MHKNVLWITRTGLFVALLVALQAAFAVFGNQLVTGSVVNFVLIVAVMTCGLATGTAVAVISPAVAALFGVGVTSQFPLLIPVVALGNFVLILLWFLIGNRNIINKYAAWIIALIVSAGAKFLVLYLGATYIVTLFITLPPPVLTAMSLIQLFVALIGGAVAIAVLPLLKKALKAHN
jgi:hypothetical protein